MVPPHSPHTKTSSTSSTTNSRAPSQQHEYSCTLCKQRKVRCDRGNPCSGCVRAGVDCVPGARQPYKRRKRTQQSEKSTTPADTDNPRVTAAFQFTPSRPLVNRPLATQQEPPPQQPQIPTFGQYGTHSPFPLRRHTQTNLPERNLWTGLNEEVRPSPCHDGHQLKPYLSL